MYSCCPAAGVSRSGAYPFVGTCPWVATEGEGAVTGADMERSGVGLPGQEQPTHREGKTQQNCDSWVTLSQLSADHGLAERATCAACCMRHGRRILS